ncbi:GTP pyrophosphokinase family protein [Geobacter sp. AOG1]|uniref:GTP pyrophosphokinase n=1 Tax=Geobacter sp. AOG1 TaxID=1566346 RepID=UPI001CC6792D|nr:(p)ppGpp synthetase [Geobacter sp. AOG1]GFE56236.1 (p)ppGpp synthetase [Geobacter sp. AOG1]
MASLDFEQEKRVFSKYYESNRKQFAEARNAYIRVIGSLLKRSEVGEITKIEGRVKEKEECIKKFHRKYQGKLETDEQPYEIKDFISDLIGIRIVCLYEDQIPVVSEVLQRHFKTLDVTDKILAVESTEDSFGYKGLHLDLALNDEMASQPKYLPCADQPFEVQIRSLIQDAWSVLDHKIKYKKSIPIDLKRRINILSALFELADREFKEIRNATTELMQQATVAPISDPLDDAREAAGQAAAAASAKTVNVFNFLRVAGHFFRDFEFEDHKVDDFVQDILKLDSGFQKSDLHTCLIENLKTARDYRDHLMAENPDRTFSPYTLIRHCLYLYDQEVFGRILAKRARERFAGWLKAARGTSA